MRFELKVQKMGDSFGVELPEEALAHLKAEEGDVVILTEAQNGWRLTKGSADFAKTMAAFKDLNHRYRETLQELTE